MTTKQKHGSLIGHEKGNSGSINTHQSILSLPPGMCFQSTLHCELGRDDRPTTMRSTKGCGRAFSIRTAMPPTRRTWGNTRRAFECGRWRNRTYVCSMDEEDVDKIIGAHKGCAIFDCKVSMTLLLVRPLSFVFCVYVCISNTCSMVQGYCCCYWCYVCIYISYCSWKEVDIKKTSQTISIILYIIAWRTNRKHDPGLRIHIYAA